MKLSVADLWSQSRPYHWIPVALGLGGFCLGLLLFLKVAPLLATLAALLVTLLVWAIFHPAQLSQFWGQRSTRSSTNALVSTLAVLAILAVVNFLAVRYSARFDLSENQLFSLSPQSVEFLQKLDQPVKIWVFSNEVPPALRSQLDLYRQANPRQVQYEIVDPRPNPGLARRYEASPDRPVVVSSGERYQAFGNPSEAQIIANLGRVTRRGDLKIAFLQGHGERSLESSGQGSLTQAAEALKRAGHSLTPLNLIQAGSIAAGTDLLILASPRQALLASEVNALKTYLEQGGKLLLLTEPDTNPGLDSLLKAWGITLQADLAIDPSATNQLPGSGPAVLVISQFPQQAITRGFGEAANSLVIFPEARSLKLNSEQPGLKVEPLLQTNVGSWGEVDYKDTTQSLAYTEGRDIPGPLDLGVAVSKATAGGQPNAQGRLVVFGGVSFAVDGLFGEVRNGDLFLNAVNWLSGSEDPISIRPKEPKNRRLTLNSVQQVWIVLVSLALLPLLGFLAAGVLWWRRR